MTRSKIAASAAVAALAVPAAALAAGHSSSTKLPVMKVTEANNAIAVTGSLKSGATSIVFSSDKPGPQPTSLLLVRLKKGVTPQQALAGVKPDGSNIDDFGRVQATGDASKGHSGKLQTVLQPATYLAVDPGDENGRGPTHDFTVTKASKPKSLPKPDATLRMVDYRFKGLTTVRRGELVRTINAGKEDHMAAALKVPKGMTAAQVIKALKKGQDQQLQSKIKEQGGLIDMVSPGAVDQGRVDLSKGTWVLACFMDNKKGVEHTRLGMESELTVK